MDGQIEGWTDRWTVDVQDCLDDMSSAKDKTDALLHEQVTLKRNSRISLWEPTMSDDLQEGFNDGSWYYALMRRLEYGQHSCEMAMNSADDYHFDTLHAPFPIPMVEKVVKGVHKIKAWYEKGMDPHGKEFKRKEYSYITEDPEGLYFFGSRSLPVPFSGDFFLLLWLQESAGTFL